MENEKSTIAPNAGEAGYVSPQWATTATATPAQNVPTAGKEPRYRVKGKVVFGEHPTQGRVPVLSLETGEVKKGGGFRMMPDGPQLVDTPVKKDFFCGDVIDVPLPESKIAFLLVAGLIEEV
jgi:hypothetical protein